MVRPIAINFRFLHPFVDLDARSSSFHPGVSATSTASTGMFGIVTFLIFPTGYFLRSRKRAGPKPAPRSGALGVNSPVGESGGSEFRLSTFFDIFDICEKSISYEPFLVSTLPESEDWVLASFDIFDTPVASPMWGLLAHALAPNVSVLAPHARTSPLVGVAIRGTISNSP